MNVWRFNRSPIKQTESPEQDSSSRGTERSGYPNGDILAGLQFFATMQLRTPLRVLIRHGEIFTDLPRDPPAIAREQWEGVWASKLHSFRELGIALDEPADGWMASSIGPIPSNGGDYLEFLKAVRQIAELANPVEERSRALAVEVGKPRWKKFSDHMHHGPEEIASYFFPPFLRSIPRLPASVIAELDYRGINSPATLDRMSDSDLLAIPGIGSKILDEIRKTCAAVTSDRDANRLDTVRR